MLGDASTEKSNELNAKRLFQFSKKRFEDRSNNFDKMEEQCKLTPTLPRCDGKQTSVHFQKESKCFCLQWEDREEGKL